MESIKHKKVKKVWFRKRPNDSSYIEPTSNPGSAEALAEEEATLFLASFMTCDGTLGPEASLVLWTKQDRLSQWMGNQGPDEIARKAIELARSQDVYLCVALQNQELALRRARELGKAEDLERIRGTAETTVAIFGFVADIDVAHPCHKEKNLPPTYEEALKLLKAYALPPTFVLDSGHGLQVLWVFDKPWIFSDDDDRLRAESICQAHWKLLSQAATAKGWRIDPTSSLAQMVRIPGTTNRKVSEEVRPVRVLEHDRDHVYPLIEHIKVLDQSKGQEANSTPELVTGESGQPLPKELLEGCAWFKHCWDDSRSLPEPEWYAALSILVRLPDGEALCHSVSVNYPGYSQEETQQKLEHARASAGPRTCRSIAAKLGGYDRYCSNCPHWKRITSPIQVVAPTQTSSMWEPPQPLPVGPKLPEFPLEALPDGLAQYVRQTAAAIDVSPDLPAMLALGTFAFAASRFFRVRVRSGHQEALCIWVLVVLSSGERKTATFKEMTQPLVEFEAKLREIQGPKIQQLKERRAIEDLKIKRLREQIAKAPKGQAETLQNELLQLVGHRTEVPEYPKLWVSDVTPERVPGVLATQGGRIAVLDPEGGEVFDQLCGRYSAQGKSNLDAWLKAHDEESVRVDRVGRDPVDIDRPSLTAILTAQPIVVEEISVRPELRGRGFLARLALSFPSSRVGKRIIDVGSHKRISADLRKAYRQAVCNILEVTCTESDTPRVLALSVPALQSWLEMANQVERAQADGGELAPIRDWASKLAGLVARIAGVLHVIRHAYQLPCEGISVDSVDESLKGPSDVDAQWTSPISKETMEGAIQIGLYLLEHARHFFKHPQSNPALHQAERLLVWLGENRPVSFSRRDYQRSISRGGDPRLITEALQILEDHGFIRLHPMPPKKEKGRPEGMRYDVNPLFYRQVDKIDKKEGEKGFSLGEPGGVCLRTGRTARGGEPAPTPSGELMRPVDEGDSHRPAPALRTLRVVHTKDPSEPRSPYAGQKGER